MKVLIVMQHVGFFRNLEPVIGELDGRKHELVLLHGSRPRRRKQFETSERERQKYKVWQLVCRAIQQGMLDFPAMTVGFRPEPRERRHALVRQVRTVVNRWIYLQDVHPSPDHRAASALETMLSPEIRFLLRPRLTKLLLRRLPVLRIWRAVEARIPASETALEVLRDQQPDVLLVSPAVWSSPPVEADYFRAARSLGIPAVGYVNSWDNLTSKGTLHVLPDMLVVWNEPMAREAEEIHQVPRDQIHVSGAPYLDPTFALRPSRDRVETCRAIGCDKDRPYVLYLATSRTLIASEVDVVNEIADALDARFPEDTPTIVVRPHPMNPYIWNDYERAGVVIYPRFGGAASTSESWQNYFDQLSAAACVVGLNTTAFLEAAVADRPCLTIVGPRFYTTHAQTGHFRHLVNAGFLEVSNSTSGVAERVAQILDGADEKREARHAFVHYFLRPRSVDNPVAPNVVDLLERLAHTGAPQPLSSPRARREKDADMRIWNELEGMQIIRARAGAMRSTGCMTALSIDLASKRRVRIRATKDEEGKPTFMVHVGGRVKRPGDHKRSTARTWRARVRRGRDLSIHLWRRGRYHIGVQRARARRALAVAHVISQRRLASVAAGEESRLNDRRRIGRVAQPARAPRGAQRETTFDGTRRGALPVIDEPVTATPENIESLLRTVIGARICRAVSHGYTALGEQSAFVITLNTGRELHFRTDRDADEPCITLSVGDHRTSVYLSSRESVMLNADQESQA
jgi:hypothetical protein